MVMLNAHGEVADFVNESQFEGGESAYECVAFSAALIKLAGQPGKGPTGTGEQVDQTADFWYGKEEGGYAASNTNGMSLDAEYVMLRGLGLRFHALPINAASVAAHDIAYIKAWLHLGYPVLICGAETGMHDLDLGDNVPYAWKPTGNHAIVACGVASDGNLLVRDTASIAPQGVRPGPRRYDAGKLQLISGTAVEEPWLPALPANFDPTKEVEIVIAYNTPGVKDVFTETDPQHWLCLKTGKVLQFAILDFYKRFGNAALCGLTYLGLPLSNEIPLVGSKHGAVKVHCENGVIFYDPFHEFDSRPGTNDAVYLAKIYSGPGVDPAIAILEAQLAAAQKPQIIGVDPTKVKSFQQAAELQTHDIVQRAQALESALIVPLS